MKEEYRTKDGRTFDNYQDYVAAKRNLNQQVLQQLGLDKPLIGDGGGTTTGAKKTGPPAATGRRPQRRAAAAAAPSASQRSLLKQPARRSKRVKGEAVSSLPSSEVAAASSSSARKKKRAAVARQAETQLTERERQSLRASEKWLDALQTYLVEEEQLSAQNLRTVMRQVEKLVGGIGITYRHWDEGVVFRRRVTLRDDFEALHAEAVEFENRHGRDLGNGWLLRHPITKLARYQHYLSKTDE